MKQRKVWKAYRKDYWEGVYLELNPFMGAPRCPICQQTPVKELFPDEWPNPATSITKFKCANGHLFGRSRTHD
jgi:hypothetical protein